MHKQRAPKNQMTQPYEDSDGTATVAKKPRAGRKAKGQKVARGRGKYRGK